MTTDTLLVLCTIPSTQAAQQLATLVVEQKVAACVNIAPQLLSVYEWEGKIEQASEQLLLIKTTVPEYSTLEKILVENHPYDTPEVIAVEIAAGLPAYLSWIAEVTG